MLLGPCQGEPGAGTGTGSQFNSFFPALPLLNHHLSKSSYKCTKRNFFFFLLPFFWQHIQTILHFFIFINIYVNLSPLLQQRCFSCPGKLQVRSPALRTQHVCGFLSLFHFHIVVKAPLFFPPLFFSFPPPVYVLSSLIYSLEKETLG